MGFRINSGGFRVSSGVFKATPTNLTYTVGQAALGGTVAYILQSGDSGYDANVQHGLITSTSDIGFYAWFNGTYTTTGAAGTGLGTGLSNTNLIIASQGNGSYAAKVCRDFNGGGYTDWYLPSKDELNILRSNRATIGNFLPDSYGGGFNNYWSSTEATSNNAWYQIFSSGAQFSFNKFDNTISVRAIRNF